MTDAQYLALQRLHFSNYTLLKVEFQGNCLKVKYLDTGGNTFYRAYAPSGYFRELEYVETGR